MSNIFSLALKRKPSALHIAARKYAELGIKVFPCKVGSKEPATEHGHKDATDDLETIEKWWSEEPFYNIALCPEDIGLAVLDIEHDAPPNWSKGQEVPETYEVQTPRGGKHLYFEGSLPTTVRRLFKNVAVDTRGRGGYVLAPPSIVDGRPYVLVNDADYAPVPEWICTALVQTSKLESAATNLLDTPANVLAAVKHLKALEPLTEKAGADAGTYAAATVLRELGLSEGKALEVMNEHLKIAPRDHRFRDFLARKILNAYKYGQNAPGASAAPPAAEVFGQIIETTSPQKRSRYYPVGTDEMDAANKTPWLVPELIQEATTVLMVGETQSYKSFLALDIALAIAAGKETFGAMPNNPGPTFYAALEGLAGIKGDRRRAWQLARQIEGRIEDFYALPAPPVMSQNDCNEFIEQIKQRCDGRPDRRRPRLIVLETANKIMGGMDENSARDAGTLIKFCDDLVRVFGCAVLMIHHKSDKAGAADVRGSSAFQAGFDSMLSVRRTRETRTVEVSVQKHKDAAEREEPWRFQGHAVGPSLVLQPISQAEHRELTKSVDLYSRPAVGRALIDLGAIGPDGVTTMVLAEQLLPQSPHETVEERQKALAAAQRRLGERSKPGQPLEAYAYPQTGPRGATMWYLPPDETE